MIIYNTTRYNKSKRNSTKNRNKKTTRYNTRKINTTKNRNRMER